MVPWPPENSTLELKLGGSTLFESVDCRHPAINIESESILTKPIPAKARSKGSETKAVTERQV